MTFNKKILCIGCETEETDKQVDILATKNNSTNHGLITVPNFIAEKYGFYHTSLSDLIERDIINLSPQFDQVVMLDQHISEYPHWKSFISTFKLMMHIEKMGLVTKFRDNHNNKNIIYWYNILRTNKSLCYNPFMLLKDNHEETSICGKVFDTYIKPSDQIVDWATDPDYQGIRNKMLEGKLLPFCEQGCYSNERMGIESGRQFETLEAAVRFDLKSVEELANFKHPVYYEIRPSNKCNIMCRMCDGNLSHRIDKEWKTIGIPYKTWKLKPTPFDIINFETMKRIYVAGGEPTIMPEFYRFLEHCIKIKKTDFELHIGTNAMKLSDKLLSLLDHFSDVGFSVSIDGVGKVNDYIRWGSDFETIIKNARLLLDRGHKIGFQIVFTMYNITSIHEVYEFLSTEFPKSTSLVQFGGFEPEPADGIDDIMWPDNYPDSEPVLASLYKARDTSLYYGNGRVANTMIDGLIQHYENVERQIDLPRLKKFFEFNAKLDKARNCRLEDYIPELAKVRDRYL